MQTITARPITAISATLSKLSDLFANLLSRNITTRWPKSFWLDALRQLIAKPGSRTSKQLTPANDHGRSDFSKGKFQAHEISQRGRTFVFNSALAGFHRCGWVSCWRRRREVLLIFIVLSSLSRGCLGFLPRVRAPNRRLRHLRSLSRFASLHALLLGIRLRKTMLMYVALCEVPKKNTLRNYVQHAVLWRQQLQPMIGIQQLKVWSKDI